MRDYYYLDGNTIVVKEDGVTKKYLAFTDNIGSILSVIDENGTKVFDASYDAWGRQTVTLNDIGLRRGYSGHEMMPESGLINMNGRLYDPVIGSFLSCDNYVQMPDNSQNFNRYSYCLNNPLKYTDPSGEFAWFIPAIAAIVGGTTNLVANWDNCDGFWQCVAAFGVGAGAGAAVASTGGTASLGTVIATSAISSAGVAATNSVIAQTGKSFEGLENVDWMNVGKNALIGAASGAASGAAGYWASNTSLSVNGFAVKSPLLRSAIVSPIAAGAGHVVGGTVGGLLEGNSLGDSFANSFAGIGTSMALGGVIGVTTTMVTCYAEGISPWTGEKVQLHHSFPKALGGDVNQDLTPMATGRHQDLHREMNQYLKCQMTEIDGKFVDMYPRRGNSGVRVQNNFTDYQRFNAVKGFYDLHQIKYFDVRYQFYKNNGIINKWRPW